MSSSHSAGHVGDPLRAQGVEVSELRRASELLHTLDFDPSAGWTLDFSSAPKRVHDSLGELVAAGDSLEEETDRANVTFAAWAPIDLGLLLADQSVRDTGGSGIAALTKSPRRRRDIMLRIKAISPSPWRFTRSATEVTILTADGRSILCLVPDALGELQAELICTASELMLPLLQATNTAAMALRRER